MTLRAHVARRESETREVTMRISNNSAIAMGIALSAVLAAAVAVRAAGDKVAFPEDFAKGVDYLSIDRAGGKLVTVFYTSREAIEAAKKGMPLPSGTVITSVNYSAQLDAQGNPVKDANGRFIRTSNILGYRAMAKRTGWGSEYPEDKRNGEWEYQVFNLDKTPNATADLNACLNCHK